MTFSPDVEQEDMSEEYDAGRTTWLASGFESGHGFSEDTLTRRCWNRVLDDLTAYLARELTPEEERELRELIEQWGSRLDDIE